MALDARLIMCFLRHLTEADAIETINQAAEFKAMIWGIGLDSAEIGHPPRKFARAFRLAAESGLCGPDGRNIVAHGGEEGDASYVIEALVVLAARRIDHGIRSLEDSYLVEVLKEN